MALILEQVLNGFQLGVMLFLIAAGLTLVFGVMRLINLAHGSLYMIGAYVGATAVARSHSFLVGIAAAILAAAVLGIAIETTVLRRLYVRDHLDQVLATFGLILFFNGAVTLLWGSQPIYSNVPALLAGHVQILPGLNYPIYRLAVVGCGTAVAVGLYVVVVHTRIGMLVRAGATNRDMVRALGVDIGALCTAVFGFGAMLAGLAGAMIGPIEAVQVGMGEQILLPAVVVIIVGGIGSIRGAVVGAVLVGLVDALARAFVPEILLSFMPAPDAYAMGGGLSSMAVYFLMALILLVRPSGLFPSYG